MSVESARSPLLIKGTQISVDITALTGLLNTGFQPLSEDLTAIAGLHAIAGSSTGTLVCTAGVWSLDTGGGSGITAIVAPANMSSTIVGSTATLAWTGAGTNIVMADGSTIPKSSLGQAASYYSSTAVQTVANTTTATSLVGGITPFLVLDQVAGAVLKLEGTGTVAWNTSAVTNTVTIAVGATTAVTFVIQGSKIVPAVPTGTAYPWKLDATLTYTTATGTSATAILTGSFAIQLATGESYEYVFHETLTINSTITNAANVTTQWSVASAASAMVVEKLRVYQVLTFSGTTVATPTDRITQGNASTVYTTNGITQGNASTLY